MVSTSWVRDINVIIKTWSKETVRLRREAKNAKTKLENIFFDSAADKINEITAELRGLRDKYNQ